MDNFIKNDQKIIEFYLTKLPTFWQNFMADMCETHNLYTLEIIGFIDFINKILLNEYNARIESSDYITFKTKLIFDTTNDYTFFILKYS